MKKYFIFILFIVFMFSSCAVISMSSYKDGKTLGLGHFRAGIGIEMSPSIPSQSRQDTLTNIGTLQFAGNTFLGIGLPAGIDIYGSASLSYPSFDAKFAIKKKLYGNLVFNTAIMPAFVYGRGVNEIDLLGNSNDYSIIGGEIPWAFTFDLFNILFLTLGIEGGYYQYSDNTNSVDFSFYNYGMYIMPEIKIFTFRLTPGIQIKRFSSSSVLQYDADFLKIIDNQTFLYPFISVSYQF